MVAPNADRLSGPIEITQSNHANLPMSDSEQIVLRSNANPTVRHLIRMRDNRSRRRAGRILVDRWRETARAVESGLKPTGVYIAENDGALGSPDADQRRVLDKATETGTLVRVSESVLEKISYGQTGGEVVAEFETPDRSLTNLRLPDSPLVVVLDKIEKPGNLGAVFRCADAAGVDAVIVTDGCELFNPNAIRSSVGAVFHVPCATATEAEASKFLSSHQIRPIAARVEGSNSLWESDLNGPLAIVLGSEADGLGDRWQEINGQPIAGIHIPMQGASDSLNLSVSAAVMLFEAVRVRR